MKPGQQKKLTDKYPKIFRQKSLPPDTYFHFECGDGWYDLIDALCTSIQSHMKYNALRQDPDAICEAVQVKEKFGGLRFYIYGGDETVYGMIRLAESMSYRICEDCGSTLDVGRTTQGWVKTLCRLCADDSAGSAGSSWKPHSSD